MGPKFNSIKVISQKIPFDKTSLGINYIAQKLLSLKLPAKKLLRRKG